MFRSSGSCQDCVPMVDDKGTSEHSADITGPPLSPESLLMSSGYDSPCCAWAQEGNRGGEKEPLHAVGSRNCQPPAGGILAAVIDSPGLYRSQILQSSSFLRKSGSSFHNNESVGRVIGGRWSPLYEVDHTGLSFGSPLLSRLSKIAHGNQSRGVMVDAGGEMMKTTVSIHSTYLFSGGANKTYIYIVVRTEQLAAIDQACICYTGENKDAEASWYTESREFFRSFVGPLDVRLFGPCSAWILSSTLMTFTISPMSNEILTVVAALAAERGLWMHGLQWFQSTDDIMSKGVDLKKSEMQFSSSMIFEHDWLNKKTTLNCQLVIV
ncbi:hypothetical protein MJT46_016081 [Ovis ammon polii x Ovis aries]|nr:hypothetical protein MJT46_016081 [Ovis ammon polii x Ovis aries]